MGFEIINKLKKEKGLTNDQLSELSGVPKGTLSKITAGITKNPNLDTVKAIANALGCSLEDFNDYEEQKENSPSALAEDEQHLLNNYKMLTYKEKEFIQQVVNLYIKLQQEKSLSSTANTEQAK